MPDTLHLDYETAADVSVTTVGLDVYTSPRSRPRVLMGAYRINGGRLLHWEAHKRRLPAELVEALEDPEVEKWAFNAQFERVVTERVLDIRTPVKSWRCSMALSYMHSFMGGLEDVGEQIGLPISKQKQKDGKRLIRMFCMPQRVTKNQPHVWRDWNTDPEEWEQFCDYNVQDVIAEEAVLTRLAPFPVGPDEWKFYALDQIINDRGIPVDMDFVDNLIWMAARRKAELLKEMRELTGVANPNSGQQLLPWLQEHGYPYDDLRKESVEKTINRSPDLFDCDKEVPDEEAPPILRVLRRRQWAARTSTTKANAAKLVVGDDGRARYLFQFLGASRTGRFAGRLIQPQNMTRTPKCFDAEESDAKLSFVTDLIRAGDYDAFDDLFISEPMLAFTGCMRGLFRAPDDMELVTADSASIESAVLAWMTNCERLLEVFRTGRDPYKDFGMEFYKKPAEEVTRAERQICKPPTLGCGYRLSAGKDEDGVKTGLLAYAENMGVQMTQPEATRAVKIFREIYHEVPTHWYAYEKAFRLCVKTKQPQKVGPVTFKWMKPYLLIELPSGRCIYYYKPRLEQRIVYTREMITRRSKGPEYEDSFGVPAGQLYETEKTYEKTVFTYMGKNQKNSQWTRLDSHGGLITENIDQAIARDVLRECLMRCHKFGFYLIGHSHDEGMAEERKGDNQFTLSAMVELFKEPIWWAPGMPLGAAGWVGQFYRK